MTDSPLAVPAEVKSPGNVKERLHSLDVLRGIAALMVVWFHFTHGNPKFLPDGWLKQSGASGWIGFYIFFVISGFVIPYTLWKSRYDIQSFPRFLFKRTCRLYPPYLCIIIVVLVMDWLSTTVPGYQGHPFHFSIRELFLNLTYLADLNGGRWYNPVFWTLAIEMQYYFLIGLIFPTLSSGSLAVRIASSLALASLAFLVPHEIFVFKWLPLFLVGIWTFQLKACLISLRTYGIALICLGAGLYFIFGALVSISGMVTGCVIATGSLKSRVLEWFGKISYSLYLVHCPIGGRIINLGGRLGSGLPVKVLVLCAAFAVCFLAATILFYGTERIAMQWSKSIKYKVATA